MADSKTYVDVWVCPTTGKNVTTFRRTSSAGKPTSTWCDRCCKSHTVVAGPVHKEDRPNG